MAIVCGHCSKQYDATLFQFDNIVICECGSVLTLADAGWSSRDKMEVLKRAADRVCSLILNSEYPRVDIEIEKKKVRDLCNRLFPGRNELFEMIYGSRFDRLEVQFGEDK